MKSICDGSATCPNFIFFSRGVNLVTYFNLFITNVFRFHKSFNDSMKDSLLMN